MGRLSCAATVLSTPTTTSMQWVASMSLLSVSFLYFGVEGRMLGGANPTPIGLCP